MSRDGKIMLIIKDGYMTDPAGASEGVRDIVIDKEIIAGIFETGSERVKELEQDPANRVIDVRGKVVAPGLVDSVVLQ